MLRFRPNAFNQYEVEYGFDEKHSVADLYLLLKKKQNIPDELDGYFIALINGTIIERDYWGIVYPKQNADVLIALVPAGGSGREILRTVIVAAATAGGFVITNGSPWGALAGNIAGTLVVNALFPVEKPTVPAIEFPQDAAESQMYSLQGQSNSARKYGFVPKVYGSHKFFPILVATPYTEIEPDAETGELVQYFYAIYDFGLGPALIEDIQIGGNPIVNFTGVTYRLVDLNKPLVSEGAWDDVLNDTFTIYKGDVETDQVNISLTGNQNQGAPVSQYQVTRNASAQGNNDPVELIVDFAAPRGLQSFNTEGSRGTTTVELDIEFAPVGTEDWQNFNDTDYVSSFSSANGQSDETRTFGAYNVIEFASTSTDINSVPLVKNYDVLYQEDQTSIKDYSYLFVENYTQYQTLTKLYKATIGFKAGRTSFISSSDIGINWYVRYGGNIIGQIQSKTPVGGGYYEYTLFAPLAYDIALYSAYFAFDRQFTVVNTWQIYAIYKDNIARLTNTQFQSSLNYVFNSIIQTAGIVRFTGNTANALYGSVRFTPLDSSVQYKVRVSRIRTYSQFTFQVVSDVAVLNLTTRFDREPIITTKRHVFMELKIKATNQINGNLQNLSAVVTSVLDVYNGTTWEKAATSNPAWVIADMLTGQVNKRAIDKSRLDLPSLLEWEAFCDEIPTAPIGQSYGLPRYRTNFVLDFTTTLNSLINRVATQCQASLNIIDGKYGVLIDKLRTTPVQLFTPRNSWNFSSQRNYTDLPDGIKVKYIDPLSGWEQNEVTVYNTGKDISNAEVLDQLDTFACTNFEQAYRFGKFMFAQAKLRQENISITVDFENLVCTRGDYVLVTQDVMRAGGTPARVKSVVGNQITIDDGIAILPVSYGYTFRSVTGTIYTGTLTVVNSKTFDLTGTIPQVGDLIVIGEVSKITIDCMVKSIVPRDDLTADLLLVERAADIYDAESLDVIPDYVPNLAQNAGSDLVAPSEVRDLAILENDWACTGTGYLYYIDIDWEAPEFGAFELFEIYVDVGRGFELHDYVNVTNYRYEVDEDDLGIEHTFKVVAVSANGKKLDLGVITTSVSATPLEKVTPPSNVEALYINVTGEVIQLNWPAVTDCDVEEYLIRYTPSYSGLWEASIPLVRTDRNTTLASAQARTGTYLVKAIDRNGNESAIAARAVTSIPALTNLNIIEETTDFPTLPGGLETVVKDGDTVILKKKEFVGPPDEYYSEGYYYYANLLDLGEIYTVRLQSLIEAEGFTDNDLMSNWITLDTVLTMSGTLYSEWDVETQFRSTDAFNVISDWLNLSDIISMSEGEDDAWGPWTSFTIGDFTARIFQFRLRLVSNKPSVTPRVFDGIIRADMPDRIESGNNLISSVLGTTITHNPAFKGPSPSPSISISQDDAEQGDYYKITGKTLEGFTITFYDKNDVPVSRQFDYMVKGYGRKNNAVI